MHHVEVIWNEVSMAFPSTSEVSSVDVLLGGFQTVLDYLAQEVKSRPRQSP